IAGARTLLVLHDFHWADEATAAVLDYLTSAVQAHPILVCVSVRTGEPGQRPLGTIMDLVTRQKRDETMALEAFSEELVQRLITSMLGEEHLGRTIAT